MLAHKRATNAPLRLVLVVVDDRMSERRRARITTAIALALHVGVLVSVRSARVSRSHPVASSPPDVDIEVAVVAPTGPTIETPVAPSEKPEAARTASLWKSTEPPAKATTTEQSDLPPQSDREDAPVALLVAPPPANIGIAGGGGTNPFLMGVPSGNSALPTVPATAGPGGEPPNDAKRKVEASLRFEQRERDVSLGLGPDGPVLRALRDSTYSSLAPNKGKAVFLAVVDASGTVVDVRLVSTDGNDSAWQDARERAAKALLGQKLALRGAKGAEVRVEVSSDVLLPSGNRPDKSPVQPTLKPSKIVMPENAPSAPVADTVQSWTVATFDLSDIGAKPRRIVRARVVETRFF
jgi:hypothetical protein